MKLTIELRNSTPLLIGWYEPSKIDQLGLRTTEIKGIWRWWARAFVGGVLYDKGYLRGRTHKDVLLKPTDDEVVCISKIVGKVLGLGLAIKEESMASRFKLFVDPLQIQGTSARGLEIWNKAQRIKLLTMKEDIEAIQPGTQFKLHVEWPSDFPYAEVALKILVVSLQLTGLGKGSRKGLGSLDIVSITGDSSFIKKILDEPNHSRLRKLLNEIYSECEETIFKEIRNIKECRHVGESDDLPPLPVISKKKLKMNKESVPVTNIKVYPNVTSNLFLNIHNFFIRSERCRVIYNNPKCKDDFRRKLFAWFLGLPRHQKIKIKGKQGIKGVDTGYFITIGVTRRASPIHLTLHSDANKLGRGAFVTTLLSGDWPRQLRWYWVRRLGKRIKKGWRNIAITNHDIINAYNVFNNVFNSYMFKINAGMGVDLWP